MIRFFYNLLFPIVLLFFLPGILVKMVRRGNYRHKFGHQVGVAENGNTGRTQCGGNSK